jgi:hypothetical protein
MNRLTLKLDLSIDGFLATQDHDVSWIPADFDDELTAFQLEVLEAAGTHVTGRGSRQRAAAMPWRGAVRR